MPRKIASRKKEKLASIGGIPEFPHSSDDNEEDLLTGENREERKHMAKQVLTGKTTTTAKA